MSNNKPWLNIQIVRAKLDSGNAPNQFNLLFTLDLKVRGKKGIRLTPPHRKKKK